MKRMVFVILIAALFPLPVLAEEPAENCVVILDLVRKSGENRRERFAYPAANRAECAELAASHRTNDSPRIIRSQKVRFEFTPPEGRP